MNIYSLQVGMEKDKVTQRRTAIKNLIKSHHIENQTTLVTLLKEKYNIETNQSIVSRDLSDLEVNKKRHKNMMIYELKDTDASKELLRLSIRNIEFNETMIVVTVLSGVADFVGDFLDAHKDSLGILGTLAGENMILVVPHSIQRIHETYQALCECLYFNHTYNALKD